MEQKEKKKGALPQIKISVIIPVYNAAGTLEQTLDSLLNQSLKEIEIICVDDGSTDASRGILKAYEKKDARVKVIFQENMYAGIARNNGMDIATGEYLHFLDADDYVYEYAYEALYYKASENNLDILFAAAVDWDVQRGCFAEKERDNLSGLKSGDFCRLLGLEEGSCAYKTSVAPWAAIYRREFIEEKKIRFSGLKCVNDRSFHAAVITNAQRMMASRTKTVFHRIGQPGSLIGNRSRNFDCHFRSLETIAERLEQDNICLEVQERILTAECTDMFVWFKRFCAEGALPQDLQQQILEQTESFVYSYQGRFAHMVRAKYRNAVTSLSETETDMFSEAFPFCSACPDPKISVIIPVQTAKDDLTETLYSLSVQTLRELEFICVNSKTDSYAGAVLDSFAFFDGRFTVINKEGALCGEAVNAGIAEAKGKYIYAAAPGTLVDEKAFDRLWSIARKNNPDLILTDYSRFTLKADGTPQETVTALDPERSLYGRIICSGKLPGRFFMTEDMADNGIIKTDFLRAEGIAWNDKTPFGNRDIRFRFRILMEAERVWLCDRPFFRTMTGRPEAPLYGCSGITFISEEFSFLEGLYSAGQKNTVRNPLVNVRAKIAVCMLDTISTLTGERRRQALHLLQDTFKRINEPGYMDPALFTPLQWDVLEQAVSDPDAFEKNIRVSVIMPVYNASAYLCRTLESILAKNSYPVEIICVDDGSTDESPEILKRFAREDSRVRVITQKNAGAGAARNNGLKYAKGEYLSFLDSDDFFEADMLSAAYFKAHSEAADVIVFGSGRYIEKTGCYETAPALSGQKNIPHNQPFCADDIKEDLFETFMGWPWDKLFRRDFIEKNGFRFQEIRNTNDVLFVWSAIIKAERIITMDDVLIYRRLHETSVSRSKAASWDCFYKAWSALKDKLTGWGVYERYEQDFVNRFLSVSFWNLGLLSGPAYSELYTKLKEEWFDALGVSAHDMDYFYSGNRGNYRQLVWMLSNTPEDFLLLCIADMESQSKAAARKKNTKSAAKTAEKIDFSQKKCGFITARADIKNIGRAENNVEISGLSQKKARVTRPDWFADDEGTGCVVFCEADRLHSSLDFHILCVGDGQLSVTLRGIDLRDEDGSRIPCWIDYTEFAVNGCVLPDAAGPVWHNRPYRYERSVKDGEEVSVSFSWMPHSLEERKTPEEPPRSGNASRRTRRFRERLKG